MDLVDIARATIRRWPVVLVVLLFGGVLAVVLSRSVDYAYQVETRTILLGPTSANAVEQEETGLPSNPYTSFSTSLEITGGAAGDIIDGSAVRERISDEGFTGTYVLGYVGKTPLILVTAEAPTAEAAMDLAARVTDELELTVDQLQADSNVAPERRIDTRLLTTSEATRLDGGRQRALLGIIGVAIAAAVGLAVILEAPRRPRSGQGGSDEPAGHTAGSAPTEAGPSLSERGEAMVGPTGTATGSASGADSGPPSIPPGGFGWGPHGTAGPSLTVPTTVPAVAPGTFVSTSSLPVTESGQNGDSSHAIPF